MSHFILNNAKRYSEPDDHLSVEDALYDTIGGFWRETYKNELFIETEQFHSMSSKKEDRETGEDMKGE